MVFDYVGEFGPVILMIFTIFLLIHKKVFLTYYFTGLIINTVLNIILKLLIRDPRPSDDTVQRLNIDQYGMPSGHSQSVGFSTSYIYLTLHNPNIFILYVIVSMLTMYQRYTSHCHTISQIILGYIVGIGIGCWFMYMASIRIQGHLQSKEDDNAYVLYYTFSHLKRPFY